MEKLFELSAELTLDAAAFLRSLAQAEKAMQTAAVHVRSLQSTARNGWRSVAEAIQFATEKLQKYVSIQSPSATVTTAAAAPAAGYATGIDYVPYNGFPALLHQGEAVLTALEAQRWRQEPNASSSTDFHAESLAQAIAAALSGVAVQMDGQTVGQLVTPTVSREIARQAAATY